jgi:hypothetical protein
MVATSTAVGSGPGTAIEAPRSRIVTVDTSLVVDDIGDAVGKLREATTRAGGYVESAFIANDDAGSASFNARIPAERLDVFRATARRLGEVELDREEVEDVTAARADLEARVRNAHAQEQRLLRLLEERTGALADVIAAERELASVRETIERMEAQARVMTNDVDYARVRISLAEHEITLASDPFRAIGEAAEAGVGAAVNLVVGTLVVAAAAGPTVSILVAFAAMLFLAVRAVWRRRARTLATP